MGVYQQPTGHDKAVEIVVEHQLAHADEHDYCEGCVAEYDYGGIERHAEHLVSLIRAHDRAALAAGDADVAAALALPLERITEHVPHYGSFNEHRCGDPTEPCRTYDLWRIRTEWREASGER